MKDQSVTGRPSQSLRFRAQMIHLGLSERTPIDETLEQMRTTNIQDLDYLRFKEWAQELKGLEFV